MSSSAIDKSRIPDRLKVLDQWICWQAVERDGKQTKIPIKPYHTSGTAKASTTDASTWRDIEAALTFHRSDRIETDGIGFVFAPGEPIVGIDLDSCRTPESGHLTEWAKDIVDRVDSYTEISPSKTGLHILIEGELPPGRNRRGDVEMYDEARFFTVTTDHLDGTPTNLTHRRDALLGVHYEYVQTSPDDDTSVAELGDVVEGASDGSETSTGPGETADSEADNSDVEDVVAIGSDSALYARYGLDFPDIEDSGLEAALHSLSPKALPSSLPTTLEDVAGPGVDLDDDDLLERAVASKSGETIEALLDGREDLWNGMDSRYPSQSEADMGLCFYLAFWTGGDPERMDRLFRDSGLMRGKWDSVHFANGATYGDVCVARTLLSVDDYYTPPVNQERTAPNDTESADSPSPQTNDRWEYPADSRLSDGRAVEDARRLATKVQRQQRELESKRERIAELERQLQQYRTVLGIYPELGIDEDTIRSESGDRLSTRDWSEQESMKENRRQSSVEPTGGGEVHGERNSKDDTPTDAENRSGESAPTDSDSDAPGIAGRFRRWLS